MLDTDGQRGQTKSDCGNTGRRRCSCSVTHQAVARIHFVPEVIEGGAFHVLQKFIITHKRMGSHRDRQ